LQLKVDIEFNQLLEMIKQLPVDKLSRLRTELSSSALSTSKNPATKFQELLLKGPVMDDDQYQNYKQNRNHFNKWRTK